MKDTTKTQINKYNNTLRKQEWIDDPIEVFKYNENTSKSDSYIRCLDCNKSIKHKGWRKNASRFCDKWKFLSCKIKCSRCSSKLLPIKLNGEMSNFPNYETCQIFGE